MNEPKKTIAGALTQLKLDDKVRFTLTGEDCKVVERENGTVTIRWPSGDRLAYKVNDPIWHHFTLAEPRPGKRQSAMNRMIVAKLGGTVLDAWKRARAIGDTGNWRG